jgi:uncharacterized protein YbjT (DUF2867 family)
VDNSHRLASSRKALKKRSIPISPDQYCRDLKTQPNPQRGKILVTGATGYIGGRLVPELLDRGYDVRVMVRASSPEIEKRWPGVEVVAGDALDPKSLRAALQGVDTAYYLIHSLLYGPKRFEKIDREAARNFRQAADVNNVRRIIYLGGLGDRRSQLSKHLRSRQEICNELMQGSAKVTALRAAIIIGSQDAGLVYAALGRDQMPAHCHTQCRHVSCGGPGNACDGRRFL